MDNQPKKTDILSDIEFAQAQNETPYDGSALDIIVPWVIEFRVVGTPNIIKVRVTEEMLVGRPDPKSQIRNPRN